MRKSNHLEYLKKGDLVAIVSVAKYILRNDCQFAIRLITRAGLKVFDIRKTILSRKGMFSGSDKERVEMLQSVLDNKNVKAIFFARGGYGSIRIIDKLDFNKFLINPKWLVGFSDITVFLSHISKNFNTPSIHSPMPINYKESSKKSVNELFNLLFGRKNKIRIKSNKYNVKGEAKGKLVGGNLSILCSILQSNSFPDYKGNILLIEDVGEYLYSIDRMVYSLKRSGVFNNISGLIVGRFTEIKDNKPAFGQTIKEIIIHAIRDYKFPVCFDFPLGHVKNNTPVILNEEIILNVSSFVELIYLKKNDSK